MPSLQVRDMPDVLYEKLLDKAKKEHRSLAQQAVVELAYSLNIHLNNQQRRNRVMQDLVRLRDGIDGTVLSDPVELIREDRSR